jgi:hypothetical protein
MSEKLYAAMAPIPAMRPAAGIAADGASPNAAIPVCLLIIFCIDVAKSLVSNICM